MEDSIQCKKFCGKENCTICYEKSFASHPKSKMWSERNTVQPYQISKWSHKKFEFKCDVCDHYFESILSNISKGKWCPFCRIPSKNLCLDDKCQFCFKRSFASCEKSLYWSKNNNVSPRHVCKGSNEKYEFQCNVCLHDFISSIQPMTRKNPSFCPFCSNKKLCSIENCKSCFEKSFASCEKSKYLKNSDEARNILKGSDKYADFICNVCLHDFNMSIYNVVKGSWCPYCSNPPKKLCLNYECKFCFEKSFKSHHKSNEWSIKNILTPRHVFKNSGEKFLFDCKICGHTFSHRLYDITRKSNSCFCPYCSGHQICSNEKCNFCFEKSFASCEKSKFWSSKNNGNPRDFFKKSPQKFEFDCEKCEIKFTQRLSHVSNGVWCPKCKNKTEKIFLEYLSSNHLDVFHQYKPEWCKSSLTKRILPFDFFISSLNVIIEIDGPQHFRQIGKWDAPQYTQSKDLYKMKKAYDQGLSIIRIPYEYIFYDEKFEVWKDTISQNLVLREKPEIIYLCSDSRYDHFKKYNFDTDEIPEIISEKDILED
jgi:very-short-patch-repair endonuclease